MTDTATTTDPFVQIKDHEKNAEKDIERGSHKNAEALQEARIAKEEELAIFEEEIKKRGVEKLKETKQKATEEMNKDLENARSETNTLKSKANERMNDAVKLILHSLNDNILS